MAFSAGFTPLTTSATFVASFTGGDTSYEDYRFLQLTVNGSTQTLQSSELGGGSSSFYTVITGLSPSTTYSWSCVLGYRDLGVIYWSSVGSSGSFTTQAGSSSSAAYTITEIKDKSVTIHATGLTPGTYTRVYIALQENTSVPVVDQHYHTSGTSLTITVSGLEPETSYAMNVMDNDTGAGADDWIGAQYFTTKKAEGRPNDWSWTSTIATGQPIKISALEWNTFCNRINQFRNYKELDGYNFTVVRQGTAISAKVVNEAWNAINGISGRGSMPSMAVKGDPIYASIFNGMKNALNAID